MRLVDCYGMDILNKCEFDGHYFTIKLGKNYEYEIDVNMDIEQIEDFIFSMIKLLKDCETKVNDYQKEDLKYDFIIRERGEK